LAIIQVGEREDSSLYVRMKMQAAEQVGFFLVWDAEETELTLRRGHISVESRPASSRWLATFPRLAWVFNVDARSISSA
jgi:5,10-methylene-tetrahydrofolate dehydrogenase/methenyl tetrahydrofolate cyclohydrolase